MTISFPSSNYSRLKPFNCCVTLIGMGFLTFGVIGVSYPMHHIVSYTFVAIGAGGACCCGAIFVAKAILNVFLGLHNRNKTNNFYLQADDESLYYESETNEDYLDTLDKVIQEKVGVNREFKSEEVFEDGRQYFPPEMWMLIFKQLKNIKALAAISQTSTFFYALVHDKQGPLIELHKHLRQERKKWHNSMPVHVQSIFKYPELLPTIRSDSPILSIKNFIFHFEQERTAVLKGEDSLGKIFAILIEEQNAWGKKARKVIYFRNYNSGICVVVGMNGLPYTANSFNAIHCAWFKALLKGEKCSHPDPNRQYQDRLGFQITLWNSEEDSLQSNI